MLAELMNDDGTVMRGPELAAFAERQKLQRISIAELIAYRQARDKLIERAGEFPVETEIGTLTGYAFLTPFDQVYHMAFIYGRIGDGKNVLTRLHRANIISRRIRRRKADPPCARALQGRGQGGADPPARRHCRGADRFDFKTRRNPIRRGAHECLSD
jgi:3,4-dihydroxy 2-butanone 4-phosphate synthase/GTP cyclohydrolase II